MSESGGCPVTVWDGPYSHRCALGGDGGVCAYHGKFDVPDTPDPITPERCPSDGQTLAWHQATELGPDGNPRTNGAFIGCDFGSDAPPTGDESCGPGCCHALGPCTCETDGNASQCVHHTQEDYDETHPPITPERVTLTEGEYQRCQDAAKKDYPGSALNLFAEFERILSDRLREAAEREARLRALADEFHTRGDAWTASGSEASRTWLDAERRLRRALLTDLPDPGEEQR